MIFEWFDDLPPGAKLPCLRHAIPPSIPHPALLTSLFCNRPTQLCRILCQNALHLARRERKILNLIQALKRTDHPSGSGRDLRSSVFCFNISSHTIRTIVATQNLSPEEIEAIKESMRRCSPQTIDSAIQYRSTKDASLVPGIVTGIIERFLEPEARTLLKEKGDDVRIFDDLGVDSLTMLEIVMLVEDIIQITMDNDDLKDLRTINDIRSYISRKLPA